MQLVNSEDLRAIGAATVGRSKLYTPSAICAHSNEPTFPPPYGKQGARWVWKLKDCERWYRNKIDHRCAVAKRAAVRNYGRRASR